MRNIYKDDDLFCYTMSQIELITLVSGAIPYILLSEKPQFSDNDLIFVHQDDEDYPQFEGLDPIVCNVLSVVSLADEMFIVTLQPSDVDVEFLDYCLSIRQNALKANRVLRTSVAIDSTHLN